MTEPRIHSIFDEPTNTFSHVVSDPGTGRAAVYDSVLDYDAAAGRTGHAAAQRIVDYVRAQGLVLDWIIETHVHADHLSAAPYLQQHLGGKIAIGEHVRLVQDAFGKVFNAGSEFRTDGSQFDHLFRDGETYRIGELTARVIHTPGHTPACTTHVVGDAALVGDTLFMPDYGTARCDFPGGDARTLFRSIQKIFALPDETRILLCHDYKIPGRDHYVGQTTVGAERRGNVHLRDGIDEEGFVRMRTARDATLAMPRLLLPSVQVNMRAGRLPPAEDNGIRYLKIPLDAV